MAIQNSFIKIKGSLGGLTFYEMDGKSLVKTTSGVSKERILNDPNFKRTRENIQEFGASATLGKAMRNGFTGIIREIATAINEEGGLNAVNLRVAEQYINEFGKLAKTNNSIIIPSNLSDLSGMIATAMTVIKDQSKSTEEEKL